MDDGDDESGQKKNKRDALRSTTPVPFSMFDPIVAYEAISGNWINVPEVAKLGIQAAHKKLGLAREERAEMGRLLDNLQKQFRGMQEHHVQQMNSTTSRVEFLERSTKRKKKFRTGSDGSGSRVPSRSSAAGRPVLHPGRRGSNVRNTLDTCIVNEEFSDDSSVAGMTPEQQEMIDKIDPMERRISELDIGRKKELERSEAFLKRLEKHQHQTELLENRLNDELSTRALSLLFRQLIFNELPATLESFMADKFQAIKKLTDALEKKVEGELAQLTRKEHSLAKSIHGLADHLQELEEEVHSLAEAQRRPDGSSSEEDSRGLAREAGNKLFAAAGSTSPRVSRTAMSSRDETPLTTTHAAPGLAGDDEAARARLELVMGNGPPLDDTMRSTNESDAGESGSPVRARGSLATLETPKARTGHRSRASSPAHSDQEQELAESDGGLHLPQDAFRKKRGSTRPAGRTGRTPRLRHQHSNLSELSDESGETPFRSSATDRRRASVTRLVEESLSSFVQSDNFYSLVDQHLGFSLVTQTVEKQLPSLQEQTASLKQETQHQSDRLRSSNDAVNDVQRLLKETEQKLNGRLEILDQRLLKAEKFSERGVDAILASVEGRVLEFLAEAEAERARLWYQMSVLFPRFLRDHHDGKERMTLSEARAYAMDVRLDNLEDYIVRNPETQTSPPRTRRGGGRGNLSVKTPDHICHNDGESPRNARSSSSLDPRSSPSFDPRRSTTFEPRFSFIPPEPLKAPRGSRLHEVIRHLQDDLNLLPSPRGSECHETKEDPEIPPTLLLQAQRGKTLVSFDDEHKAPDLPASPEEGPHFAAPVPVPHEGSEPEAELEEASLLFVAESPQAAEEGHECNEENGPAEPAGSGDTGGTGAARPAWHVVRSVDEALADVMEGTRNLDTGEVQLIRALNPRSPNAWLIGDAALGRVILGQNPTAPRPNVSSTASPSPGRPRASSRRLSSKSS